MDRTTQRFARWAVLAALVMVVGSAAGCRMLATSIAYFVKGTDVDPEYEGLKGKKVVVVCRPQATLAFSNSAVAGDLARQVASQLRTNVSKIQVVDHQKVAAWLDEHEWMDYPEVGKAMKADMVVGIDLLNFSTLSGQTLYRGVAEVNLVVYDLKNDSKEVFQKHLPQCVYPPSVGIASSEKSEAQFRREFLRALADEIGRYFYPHDRASEFARDADVL